MDWERGRFRVHSPKTEHHEGKAERWVPIFPELLPYLEEAFDLAPEGAVYVIGRYRDANMNLRTQLKRILRRAGVSPRPRLFHNLRASRETGLAAEYPHARRLRLDRQHGTHRRQALLAGDGGLLPEGRRGRCKIRCSRPRNGAAKAGAATCRKLSRGDARRP